jgi:hypothetical protein
MTFQGIHPDSGAGPAPRPISTAPRSWRDADGQARLERYDRGVLRDWLRYYELNGLPSPLALKLGQP